jgi:predicted secreted protein
MKKSTIVLIFLLGVVFIFQGCSTGAASGTLTEKDNNKTIELEMDSPFTVKLTAEHGSGYKWKLVSDNKPSVVLEKEDVITEGGKDIYTFNFKVKDQGDEVVVIVYGSEEGVQKTFKLKVICGTMGRILSE